MGPVYNFLGLKVGLLQHDMPKSDKKQQYLCDVIHGTNNEFGFDYLRDNMVLSSEDMVQDGHPFAIIDEVEFKVPCFYDVLHGQPPCFY